MKCCNITISRKDIACMLLIIAMILINLFYYTKLPESMISHWGFNGEANGWMPKDFAIWIMPVVSVFMLGLFIAIPYIMPPRDKKNFKKFSRIYENMKLIFIGFMAVINIVVTFVNVGYNIPVGLIIAGMVAALLYYFGIIMPEFKRNYFIGIRTPWALEDENNWNKTQVYGGKVFKFIAFFILFAAFFPEYFLWLFFFPLIVGIVSIFWYSYKISKK